MRTTGFDEASGVNAANEMVIEAIKRISCPKCNKYATNVSVKNGKLSFEACCDELKQKIMREVFNAK